MMRGPPSGPAPMSVQAITFGLKVPVHQLGSFRAIAMSTRSAGPATDVHAVDRVVVERVIGRSALALLYRRCQRSGRGVARGRYLPFNQADECRHAHVAAGR